MNTLSRIILNLYYTSDLCQTPQISIRPAHFSIRPPQISISPPQYSIRPFLDLCSFSQKSYVNLLFLYPPWICVCRCKPNVWLPWPIYIFFIRINPALCWKMLAIYCWEVYESQLIKDPKNMCLWYVIIWKNRMWIMYVKCYIGVMQES
jgi:hypothetical protein